MVHSFEGRALAVYKIANSGGRNTPGIDKFVFKNDDEKVDMIFVLKDIKNYTSQPVKRVGIPKANGKIRYLGIPSIKDRCFQALFALALAPVAEVKAEIHSYAFRPGRSQRDAVSMVYFYLYVNKNLRDTWIPRYVIDADIKGFFDNIDHK
ncbi:hypothetical protein ACS49_04495 [Bacillus cereus]|nr:hypothetical protein ACS49_04495 [Bacillus cereus]